MNRNDRLSFLRAVFGTVKLSADGVNATAVCPACHAKKGANKFKLSIRVDDFRHHCWSCDLKGGTLLSLLKKYYPNHVSEYMRKWPPQQRDEQPRRCVQISVSGAAPDAIDDRPITLPRGFMLLAESCDSKNEHIRRALDYVRSRGLTDRDMWYFRLGISDSSWLRDRVIMPSFDATGRLNYWTARTFDPTVDSRWKYFNAKCQKSAIIFNELNIDWKCMLTVVEGPFDLTKCNDNAVPLLGSTIRPGSLLFEKIVENNTPICLVLDAGEHKKTRDIAEMLSRYGIDVWTADLKGRGMDPGKMTRDAFINHLETRKRWDGLSRLTDLI